MKRKITQLIVFALVAIMAIGSLSICSVETKAAGEIALQIDNPMMTVDGKDQEIDPGMGTTPVIIDNRTLVPIRAIMEAMGGSVEWNNDTKKLHLPITAM